MKNARIIEQRTLLRQAAKSIAMVGTDNDHLALVAARTADRLVREAGTTWLDLICPNLPTPPTREEPPLDLLWAWPIRWREAIKFCMHNLDLLADRDGAFVWEVNKYSRLPSERQLAWLKNCVERCRLRGAKA